jgi:hypothetical protein
MYRELPPLRNKRKVTSSDVQKVSKFQMKRDDPQLTPSLPVTVLIRSAVTHDTA